MKRNKRPKKLYAVTSRKANTFFSPTADVFLTRKQAVHVAKLRNTAVILQLADDWRVEVYTRDV